MIKRVLLSFIFMLAHCITAQAAITIGNSAITTAATSGDVTLTNYNHNGDYLLFFVALESTSNKTITGVTYNAVSATLVTEIIDNNQLEHIAVYYMDDAPTGAHNAVMSHTGSTADSIFGVLSISGAQNGAPEVSVTKTAIDSLSISNSITTLTADSIIVELVAVQDNNDISPDNGQTYQQETIQGTALGMAIGTKIVTTATAYTIGSSHTGSSAAEISQILISVAPATAGGSRRMWTVKHRYLERSAH